MKTTIIKADLPDEAIIKIQDYIVEIMKEYGNSPSQKITLSSDEEDFL